MVSRVLILASGFITAALAWQHPARVAGIYEGAVVVKNSDARKVTLNLKQDGTGELRDGAKTAASRWSATGTEVQLEVDGRKEPMIWRVKGNALTLQGQDRAEYGKKGLVLRRPR